MALMPRKEHRIKCWPEPFDAVASGLKRHEIRVFDRDYQAGDWVTLLEWRPSTETYTGRSQTFIIGHVTPPGEWGLPDGLGVFTLLPADTAGDDLAAEVENAILAYRRAKAILP